MCRLQKGQAKHHQAVWPLFFQGPATAKEVQLQADLEAVGYAWLQRLITMGSIYSPPDKLLQKSDFANLINQLPEPYVIAGDYNAHHPLWGCEMYDARGRMIDLLLKRLMIPLGSLACSLLPWNLREYAQDN